MSGWHVSARRTAQRLGLDPRYLRRLRWITKARGVSSVGAPLLANARFILSAPEPHNYTYELANRPALVDWSASVAGVAPAEMQLLADAVDADDELRRRLRAATRRRWWWTKREPPFGRRVAWYLLVRVLKPALVVETGVHDGLGSLLLLRALELNAAEGSAGRLVSFDINPRAGWLVGADERWELRIEPASAGLAGVLAASGGVGLFIHDSLHTYENEHLELSTAERHLAAGGVLLTDNAHATSALRDICEARGLTFSEFREAPREHFYPGGAMAAGRR
jgi:hypothetical protein